MQRSHTQGREDALQRNRDEREQVTKQRENHCQGTGASPGRRNDDLAQEKNNNWPKKTAGMTGHLMQ